MKMHEIYCVIGATGEYSDSTEWVVCWLENEAEASKYAKLAEARAKELFENDDTRYDYQGLNQYDPQMLMYYTGTTYSAVKVPKAIWKTAAQSGGPRP